MTTQWKGVMWGRADAVDAAEAEAVVVGAAEAAVADLVQRSHPAWIN